MLLRSAWQKAASARDSADGGSGAFAPFFGGGAGCLRNDSVAVRRNARSGKEMRAAMRAVLSDAALAQWLSQHGLETVLGRHTCGHRVNELMDIINPVEDRRPRLSEAAGETDRRGRLSSNGVRP